MYCECMHVCVTVCVRERESLCACVYRANQISNTPILPFPFPFFFFLTKIVMTFLVKMKKKKRIRSFLTRYENLLYFQKVNYDIASIVQNRQK